MWVLFSLMSLVCLLAAAGFARLAWMMMRDDDVECLNASFAWTFSMLIAAGAFAGVGAWVQS